MSVEIGQPAPSFTLKSKKAEGVVNVSLEDYKGKNVVLLFIPLAFTGVCTDELCSVSQGIDAYENLNAEVLGVSVDSPFAQEAWAKQAGITIPLLSDFNKAAAAAYGALYDTFVPGALDMNGVAKRSAFVIDKDGVVRYAEVLENAGNVPNFDAIKGVLSELN
jgi:peroxiredoxin